MTEKRKAMLRRFLSLATAVTLLATNDMLNKVYNSEVIITRDELPNFG